MQICIRRWFSLLSVIAESVDALNLCNVEGIISEIAYAAGTIKIS